LGADATAVLVTRLLKHMKANGYSSATPHIDNPTTIQEQQVLNLTSTYIKRGRDQLPKAGDVAPWLPRTTYFNDIWVAMRGDLKKGLHFERTPYQIMPFVRHPTYPSLPRACAISQTAMQIMSKIWNSQKYGDIR